MRSVEGSEAKGKGTAEAPQLSPSGGRPAARQGEDTAPAAQRRERLGKLTKFADTFFESIDPETGEIQRLKQVERRGQNVVVQAYDQDAADLERWMLKGHARRLLLRVEDRDKRRKVPYSEFAYFTDLETRKIRTVLVLERYFVETEYIVRAGKREVQQKKGVRFRVVNCCRDKIGATVQPEIWYSKQSERASFHKLGVCGSVWTCPICSRRINLKRQSHIRAAYDLFVTKKPEISKGVRDGDAVMVTYTIRHGIGDDLDDLLGKLKEADRQFLQKSHAYKKLVGYTRTVKGEKVRVPSELAYVGRIATTEITFGDHGWHPHSHQLWFFDRRLTAKEIERLRSDLFQEWRAACLSVGLPAPRAFYRDRATGKQKAVGVDCRRALSAEEYLTKFGHERDWGPEKEMASQHTKSGKKGKTAFQLLYEYGQGDKQSGARFAVFAEATLGRHQVEFSKGLRERLLALGLDEILAADEELAAQLESDADRLGELTDQDFEALLGAEKFGIEAHGLLLSLCKSQGFDAAISWLRSLPSYVDLAAVRRMNQAKVASDDKHLTAAAKSEREFWCFVNSIQAVDVTSDIEDEASTLLFERDPALRALEWKRLENEARRRYLDRFQSFGG